jgi:glycosyltransferase involved in cell wall biosynthesis
VRARNIAASLAKLGFIVHVVTPSPKLFSRTGSTHPARQLNPLIHETELRFHILNPDCRFRETGLFGRVITSLYKRFCYLTSNEIEFAWNSTLAKWLNQSGQPFDYAIVTCSPYSPAYTVMKWCKARGTPLIIDYRDLLVGNPHSRNSSINTRIGRQEAEWLANASAITTVSESWRKVLSDRPEVTCPVVTISNGFDADEFSIQDSHSPPNKPFIVYAGIFLPPKRAIDPLFEALRLLPARFQECFHYFGPDTEYVQRKSVEFNCSHLIVNHGMKPRDVIKQYLKHSHASLVISTIEPRISTLAEAGIIPAKIYEAMALGIPILAFSPENSEIAEMLKQTKAGSILSACSPNSVAAAIQQTLEYKRRYQPPAKYSWEVIGHRLKTVLESM